MTTMSRLSWRVLVLGMEKPCTRFTCRSSCFRSCTFSDCVLVLSLFSGVNSVPFRHTPLRWMDASTSPGTTLFGFPSGPVPETLSNLHDRRAMEHCGRSRFMAAQQLAQSFLFSDPQGATLLM